MSKLVLYDSQFGNTEKIAQAMAKSLPSTKLLKVNEATSEDLKGVDTLIVGSPTLGGRPTPAMLKFLTDIPADGLKNVKVAAFDTRFNEKKLNFALKLLVKTIGYAAEKMAKTLEDKGGKLVMTPEGFFVTAKAGPLASGELERAGKWLKS